VAVVNILAEDAKAGGEGMGGRAIDPASPTAIPQERSQELAVFVVVFGTLSWYSGKVDCAVDALHFAPSKHSRLLQAAGLVSYLHFRVRRSGVTDPRAVKANADLWRIVASKVTTDHNPAAHRPATKKTQTMRCISRRRGSSSPRESLRWYSTYHCPA